MKKIAVAVEGPSDAIFWDKVLHRSFTGVRFNIRDLKGLPKLLAAAASLFDTFRDARYDALFYLVDADDAPCVSEVRGNFDDRLTTTLTAPKADRWSFLSIAFRDLESWYFADRLALLEALGNLSSTPPPSDGRKATLAAYIRHESGRRLGYDERQFAAKMAVHFDPARARQTSPSFDYFWSCLQSVLAR